VFSAAAITDGLDGLLARRAGATRLGRDLDPVADALTAVAAAGAARRAGWVSTGAAGLLLARTAAPVAVVAATYFRTGTRPPTDAFRATRHLSPALIAGLALAPFTRRAGSALTSAASIASLALALRLADSTTQPLPCCSQLRRQYS
jgi:phosphatidylglycerophosphate synthase